MEQTLFPEQALQNSPKNPILSGMQVQILFGQNLKRCRRRSHLKQWELAQKIGVSESTIHNMEAGSAFVSDELLEQIVTVLGILPEELFYSGEQTTPEEVHADVVKKVLSSHLRFAERVIQEGIAL
jgi:transcriptional regulator with XRE-family HTH domain